MLFHKSVRRHGTSAVRPAPFGVAKDVRRVAAFIQSLEPRLLMAAGDLDPTFGTDGRTLVSSVFTADAGNKLAIQSDGKLLLPARSGNGAGVNLTRLNADGSLDTSYGDGTGT